MTIQKCPQSFNPLCTCLRFFVVYPAGLFAALCVANRPRFWWQEIFCSLALYWLPLAVLATAWLLWSSYARASQLRSSIASWLLWGAIVCYGYVIVSMGSVLAPYLWYSRWYQPPNQDTPVISGLWIDGWSTRDRLSDLREVLSRTEPMVVMVSGEFAGLEQSLDPLKFLPYRARTSSAENGGISIFSAIPIGAEKIDHLGVEAFPGGVFSLYPPGGRSIELGVMALVRSTTQEQFERNRITARRLSSVMRSSRAPLIVAAQFSTTPFSPFMAVYSEQVRLRSIMFGLGLYKTFNMENPVVISTDSNIFVSQDFSRVSFERIYLPMRERAALFFRVLLSGQLNIRQQDELTN
jgi:hypothetical protein